MNARRTFLISTVTAVGATGLGIGWWSLLPPSPRLLRSDMKRVNAAHDQGVCDRPSVHPSSGAALLNGWVQIGVDDTVTVFMSKAEMGQGIHTAAAMLTADALHARWSQVKLETAPIDPIYRNFENLVDGIPHRPDDNSVAYRVFAWYLRKLSYHVGSMLTGGSTSVADLWEPMQRAGVSARMMLVGAAAACWDVGEGECEVRDGRVFHARSGRSASFGALALDAGKRDVPVDVPLEAPTYSVIGKPIHRVESALKTNGRAIFGIDALPAPGERMLYASVKMSPALGGAVAHPDAIDVAAALGTAGVHGVWCVTPSYGASGGIAVVADNPFIAMNALCSIECAWTHAASEDYQTETLEARLSDALDGVSGGRTFYQTGHVQSAFKRATRCVEARYSAPYLAHGTLEPPNCTVQFANGYATVWVSTQISDVAIKAVAETLDIPAKHVTLHAALIGGGFGRRLDVDFIAQAAQIAAKHPGTMVQTLWSRPEDMTHDMYRPACAARYTAGLDDAGRVIAWIARSASQSISEQALQRTFGQPALFAKRVPDNTRAEGSYDQPYAWPNALVTHHVVDLPIPVGFWRAVGHSHQAFFVESFIDELADAVAVDPLEFRMRMLGGDARARAVLERVAHRSNWRRTPHRWTDARRRLCGRGIAFHRAFGTYVAQVAEVCISPDDSLASDPVSGGRIQADNIEVTQVYCAVDCGIAVNPILIAQQIEGGIIFGLSAALYQKITFVNGVVQQHYFSEFPIVKMTGCPAICTDIIDSQQSPTGVGEVGVPPIAPAVTNAIFAAIGARIRDLPIVEAPGKGVDPCPAS